MQAGSATEQTRMDIFLEQMGAMHSDSMHASVSSILARQKTVESEECLLWLRTAPRKPLWQIAMLAVLVNDGLIMFDAAAGECEAEHVILDPGLVGMVRDDAEHERRDDPAPSRISSVEGAIESTHDDVGAFERELEMLAI